MSRADTVKQVFQLLKERKAWWLAPIVLVFLLIGLVLVAGGSSSLSPFIYTLF